MSSAEASADPRRKLRVLVITMGGYRQEQIERMFADPVMVERFEAPTFSPGVAQRQLRSRMSCLSICYQAGLIAEEEWRVMEEANKSGAYERKTEDFFDCLEENDVPVLTEGRHGCEADRKLHYSVELWRKAKTVNRGRAVLACTLAHLIALKKFTSEGFDVLIEDNVRASPADCADIIYESWEAAKEWEETSGKKCHMRFLGWLGSVPNLRWIMGIHCNKRGYRPTGSDDPTIMPYPRSDYLGEDEEEIKEEFGLDEGDGSCEPETEAKGEENKNGSEGDDKCNTRKHTMPGGNFIWGSYAYWMSKEGYQNILDIIRHDVGSIMWKSKRMRFFSVKPIDKMLPLRTIRTFGADSVWLSARPAFIRAPMLTSKIHTKWDPEFCRSTEHQLSYERHQSSKPVDCWASIWLADTEHRIVEHHRGTGKWLTPKELDELVHKQEV